MEGEGPHWLTGAVILGGGLLVMALMWAAACVERRLVSVWRQLTCPERKTKETCRLTRDVDSGRLVDVESCSAFDRPGRVSCSKSCLRDLELASAPRVRGLV